MAELCKKCFLEFWRPYMEEFGDLEDEIVMSDNYDICEGCGDFGPYVHHIGKDISREEYDKTIERIADDLIRIEQEKMNGLFN